MQSQIISLSLQQTENLGVALLDITELSELEQWLQGH
ncbi:MAG: DUF4351 domain-containing protein, partial [Thermosynechococcaceae cyanobacterium]